VFPKNGPYEKAVAESILGISIPHLWSVPTRKHNATLIRSPETIVDHEVVRAAEILQLLGI
jgi:hypothetical protein